MRSPEESGDIYLSRGWLGYVGFVRKGEPVRLTYADCEYHHVHSADADQVAKMGRTLGRIARKLGALRSRLGWSEDFGETVMRLADAVGAKSIAFERRSYLHLTGQEPPKHDDGSHAVFQEVRWARPYLDRVRDHALPKHCRKCNVVLPYRHRHPSDPETCADCEPVSDQVAS